MTVTSNSDPIVMGSLTTDLNGIFFEATSCNVTITNVGTVCLTEVDTVVGTSSTPSAAYPGGIFVDDLLFIEMNPTSWANGSVSLTGNAEEVFIQNALYDSAGTPVVGVAGSAGVAYFSTTGTFTLTNIPTTGGTTTGAPFQLVDNAGHTFLNGITGEAAANITGTTGTLTGTLNDSCYGVPAGSSPTDC